MKDLVVKVFLKEAQLSFDKDYSYVLPAHLQEQFPSIQNFKGFRVRCPVGKGNRLVEAFILHQEQETQAEEDLELKTIESFCDPFALLEEQQFEWLSHLSKYYDVPRGKIAKLLVPSYLKWTKKQFKALAEGDSFIEERKPEKAFVFDKVLTDAQQEIFEKLNQSLLKEKKSEHLLFGVTGSGKTEIYIKLIASCLEQGKTALLLLPEIALTPMMLERFSKYFEGKMAVVHSGLSDKERQKTWLKVKQGEIKILIGARSALFAPLQDLALVIVDEEHESTYFSQQSPYYDARDVARLRLLESGMLLLGSATPSIQTMYRVEQGKCQIHHLRERALVEKLPDIVFAQPLHIKQKEDKVLLNPRLIEKLKTCFSKQSKAMILCNRRGYSRHFICKQCGQGLSCPHCSVHLVYHKKKNIFLCHHCSHQMPFEAAKVCHHCGGETFESQSYAIEAYEQALKEAFPEQKILRMDLDQITGDESHETLLKKFREEDYDLLLGTQMIAKGHDFPKVSFVGILGIDQSLNLPHYQAAERSFQLLIQAAGRAGRSPFSKDSEVYIETDQSQHYAIALALLQDTESFLKEEMKKRKLYALPPYVPQLSVLISGKKQELVEMTARQVRQSIEEIALTKAKEQMKVTALLPAEVHKLNKSYRYMFQISSEDRKMLLRMRAYLQRIQLKTGLDLIAKLDPA